MQKIFHCLLNDDFTNGFYNWLADESNPGDTIIVDDPLGQKGKVVKTHININEDFSGTTLVGSPRSEIKLKNQATKTVNFLPTQGEYLIDFDLMLPLDFAFETFPNNQHIVFQLLHVGPSAGSPQLSLNMDTNYYYLSCISSPSAAPTDRSLYLKIGDATTDLGKWVNWKIYYRPSYSNSGKIVIWKDGAEIANINNPNSYQESTQMYLKFGIYKWNWQHLPTSLSDITLYHANFKLFQGATIS